MIRVGRRYGKRVVTGVIESVSQLIAYKCDCGHRGRTYLSNLKKTTGCEACRRGRTSHGASKTPEYAVWVAMNQRCHNPSCSAYLSYGGRGLRVCKRWRGSFANFIADMGQRPGPEFSLERKKNGLGYSPGNCKWGTLTEQHRNRGTSRLLTFHGKRMTMNEWARELRMSPSTIAARLGRGMTTAQALASSTVRMTKAHARLLEAVKHGRRSGRGWLQGVRVTAKGEQLAYKPGRKGRLPGPPRTVLTLGIKLADLKMLDRLCKRFDAHRTAVVSEAIQLLVCVVEGDTRL